MNEFYLGLDLGQAADYTAVSIIEALRGEVDAVYQARHLERFKLRTSYQTIAARIVGMMGTEPLAGNMIAVVDATGVGRPVVDMLRGAGIDLVAVTITGGDSVTFNSGEYRVPKRDLVGTMQVLLQNNRLKIAAALPDAATLQKELLNFQVKIDTSTAHDSYGAWREGTHDDLVLAVALACWYAEQHGGKMVETFDLGDDEDDDSERLFQ